MPNIKLSSLANNLNPKPLSTPSRLANAELSQAVKYKDITMDFTDLNDPATPKYGVYQTNSINSKVTQQDIETSVNENAIMNSVKNWFRTTTYSRLLNPELSFNFRDYLFQPRDSFTAYFLANEVATTLPAYEPRIAVTECNVVADQVNDAFIINLQLTIPGLDNKVIALREILSSTGYLLK